MVFRLLSSPSAQERAALWEKSSLLLRVNLTSASHIFSSQEALAHTKWREALENPLVFSRVCAVVVDEGMKLTVCQRGEFSLKIVLYPLSLLGDFL